MQEDVKKQGQLSFRAFTLGADNALDEENRTIRLSFASDSPVRVWDGIEVLSHEPGAMVMGQRQESMPLLFNHDHDRIIGVVEAIEQDEHRSYATVRFARNAAGDEAMALVKDKILVNVSFGYMVNERNRTADGVEVTSWEPYEISLVTTPADPSVGVYRNLNPQIEGNQMADTDLKKDGVSTEPQADAGVAAKDTAPAVDTAAIAQRSAEDERTRIRTIQALCKDHSVEPAECDSFIENGKSVEEVRAAILETIKNRQTQPSGSSMRGTGEMNLTDKEKKQYSIVRAINACLTGDWSKAGFERELSNEIAKVRGTTTNGVFVPTELCVRDYVVGTPEDGGNLVATELLGSRFIEALRNKSVVMSLGATMLTGLVGNIEIPRQNGVASVQWIPETGTVTGSNATFDKVALTPKTIAAKSFISRNLLLQASITIEQFVRNELLTCIALGIDSAALSGSGANNEPLGIANQTGVLSVSAAEGLTFDTLIDMETAVADANADVANMAYVANAVTVGALKKLKDSQGAYIWRPIAGGFRQAVPGEVNGYPVARSNQARKDVGDGSSEMFFGNWADLVIGEWGAIEVLPNPYSSAAYDNGGVEIRALQTVDVAVRHPESFCVCSDISIE